MPNFLKPGSSREQAERERERYVRLGHEGAEITFPPPSSLPSGTPFVKKVKAHGELWDSVRKIIYAVVTIGSIVIAAFTFVVKMIIRSELDDFKARIDPAALIQSRKPNEDPALSLSERFAIISTSVARVDQKVTDGAESESKRWDKLDVILQKNFGDTTAPASPAFGPKAKQQGR